MISNNHFHQLRIEGNNYYVTAKKSFSSKVDLTPYFDKSFHFAFNMSFGEKGQHRDHRSGGDEHRDLLKIFRNTFQGKIAEFGIFDYIRVQEFEIEEPDIETYAYGIWDDVDLTVKGKRFSVKSAAFFSQLLLLEVNDWDAHGFYIPNQQNESNCYDYFILCRVRPDIKSVLKSFNCNTTSLDKKLKDILLSYKWEMDIPGYITRKNLVKIISSNNVIPNNSMLNGTMPMDTDNYYCQAGNLWEIDNLLDHLKNNTVQQ